MGMSLKITTSTWQVPFDRTTFVSGSEFRPASILEPLLGIHPLWERIKALLLEGSHFSADAFPAEEGTQQVDAALAFDLLDNT
jgi:hypothetical protein